MLVANGRTRMRRVSLRSTTRTVILALIVVMLSASCVSGDDDSDDTDDTPEPPTSVPATAVAVAPESLPTAVSATDACPAPESFSETGVQVQLQTTFAPANVVSFGLPLPAGAVTDASALAITVGDQPVEASVRVLLENYGPDGAATGPRSVLGQLPTTVLQGDCTIVDVEWAGSAAGSTTLGDTIPFAEVSVASDETVLTAERTIEEQDGRAVLVEASEETRVLFTAREPMVQATFPAGYLATTGIFGTHLASSLPSDDLAGLQFISEQVTPFGLSAMYQESYPLNPESVVGPDDFNEDAGVEGYEAWLYDRCITFLQFAVHTGDTRFLRESYRSCSYYAAKIELNGEYRGIFTGKPEPDLKYSHLRGLYAYYALTGDEAALAAGEAIAELWLNDQDFVGPYRAGYIAGPDDLWTERLLAHSLEGLYYGHLLTGDVVYLDAAREMVNTAYRHITGDAAVLAEINPESVPFPPQDCFIHNASQAVEGNADEPFCSGWMPVLMVDPLLAYHAQTDDPQVLEILIRLTRYLRDTGSAYFVSGVLDDTFLAPSEPYDSSADEIDRRLLVPLYGSGLNEDGERQNYGEYDDFLHCLDATALTAAGLWALERTGGYDQNPIGPFASEGESFLALQHEFAFCAYVSLLDQTRLNRDPANFDSEMLAEGLDDPDTFITENKIGYQSRNVSPQRKLGWWYNTALAQYALLEEAGISVPELRPGTIQP